MRFSIEQSLPGPVERVEEALFDPAFLERLGSLPKLGAPRLLDQQRDGATWRQQVRYHFVGDLSSAVTRVVDPDRLTWVEDVTLDRGTHSAVHRILPDHYAKRLECRYTTTLRGTPDHVTRVAEGEMKVHVRLVGHTVERAIVSGMRDHAAAEARALAEWITDVP